MMASVARFRAATINALRTYPWIGWAAWAVFLVIALARTHPRRYGSTFTFYVEAARRLWEGQRVYDPATLGDFLYLPAALLVLVPLLWLDPVISAAITLALFAAVFTWGCVALMQVLADDESRRDAIMLAGLLLLINIPAAWFNFKQVQSQIIMTGAMMAAAAAMMQARWTSASLWLTLAVLMKPLALVMALLCVALCPRMRLTLGVALLVVLLLPFLLFGGSYMVATYHDYSIKLWGIAAAPPSEWIYQADFSTLLRAIGIVLPAPVSVTIRLAAALATLGLCWRMRQSGDAKGFALVVLLLSGCYITLFGPRNEFLSFLVLTPAITALALLVLKRDEADYRGWLLIAAALFLGFVWAMPVNTSLKPAVVVVIYVWLGWLAYAPERWRALVGGSAGPAPA